MNNVARSICALLLLLGTGTMATAQSFEGTIEFTKTTGPVVTNYKYFVKGEHIRIEEINARGDAQGIMLVDTRDRTVTALSPDRKLYLDVPNMRLPKEVNVEVKKTGEIKELAGYKCEVGGEERQRGPQHHVLGGRGQVRFLHAHAGDPES